MCMQSLGGNKEGKNLLKTIRKIMQIRSCLNIIPNYRRYFCVKISLPTHCIILSWEGERIRLLIHVIIILRAPLSVIVVTTI